MLSTQSLMLNTNNSQINDLLLLLSKNECASEQKINLVASENSLSPLAKLPFLLDCQSRYFLDDLRRFGRWSFPSGVQIADIEKQLLVPLLSEMSGATYVNVRPISGMNCMLIALAAFTKPGDVILSIPVTHGGHVSTAEIGKTLGLSNYQLPFSSSYDIDYESLEKLLIKTRPALIYIDQASMLFPIDPLPLRNLIDAVSPETLLHYDSSHINGLILGKAIFNPLTRGAHCYGGSTHKTLAGPHKGFLATNDLTLATKIENKADHFVSHHHTGSMISLLITLMEMKWCHGEHYANQVIANTRAFAVALLHHGFYVAAEDRNFTDCHQTWMYPQLCTDITKYANLLTEVGIMTNLFDSLPGIEQPAFRLSFAEATRMGASTEDAILLAEIMATILERFEATHDLKHQVINLRGKFLTSRYFFDPNLYVHSERVW